MHTRLVIALFCLGFVTACAAPRADRTWEFGLERTAYFEAIGEQSWDLHNFRAFEFGEAGPVATDWQTAQVKAESLSSLWFFVQPLPQNPRFAHTFLTFVFEDETPSYISVSVEARKEKGEKYSALRGVFNTYELSYVWQTEKDIHTRIALDLGTPLYGYEIDIPQRQIVSVFEHFVRRTNDLHESPRWYNTVFSNCTNELAKAVNGAYPGALPWQRAYIFTGSSAKRLYELGFMDTDPQGFVALEARSELSKAVKSAAPLGPDAFSIAWRSNLPGKTQYGSAMPQSTKSEIVGLE